MAFNLRINVYSVELRPNGQKGNEDNEAIKLPSLPFNSTVTDTIYIVTCTPLSFAIPRPSELTQRTCITDIIVDGGFLFLGLW